MTQTGTGRAGGVRLSAFARRLLAEWERRAWPAGGERVLAAVSGGADSVALWLALDELLKAGRVGLSVTVAHLDHGLRGESGARDALRVAEAARALGYEVEVGRARVKELADERGDNLEQAARRARYEFLGETARRRGACAVLVAHTLDDQAETVLLRLVRGSGAEGLTGMRPERVLGDDGGAGAGGGGADGVLLLRPLLAWARRAETEAYCRERGFEFSRDEMNEDERFARVRVRKKVLPLLETFNPRAAEALARAAELLRDDAEALEAAAGRLLDEAAADGESPEFQEEARAGRSPRVEDEGAALGASPLRADVLSGAPRAVRRRALRLWLARGRGDLRRLELAHMLAVERLLGGGRGGRVVELPGGGRVERRRGRLLFYRLTPD